MSAHAIHGNKWAVISRSMPGRTDNQVKNRFNSTLRRTLAQNGKAAAGDDTKEGVGPVATRQNLSSPMGSRKQSSNQLAKQANLKRVASHILETMSCDESMESSQENKDNNTGKEATSKNAETTEEVSNKDETWEKRTRTEPWTESGSRRFRRFGICGFGNAHSSEFNGITKNQER